MSELPGGIETEISDEAVMRITPMVSVMMATYNHEQYIAEAIEGVVNQQAVFPFELIIGEDCSTDGTRNIVLDYQKRFPHIIRVVFSERNMGAFNNTNRMFRKVRSEFVAWCEGDDYWHTSLKLQLQVDYLRMHPEVSLVHTDYDYLVLNFGKWRLIDSKLRPRKKVVKEGEVYGDLLKDMFVRTCTMMGRTSLLEQHFNSELRSARHAVGDRPLVLHLSRLGKIQYINKSTAVYRRTPESMINSGFSSLVKMQKNLRMIYDNFSAVYGMEGVDWHAIEIGYYKTLATFAFRAKKPDEFEEAATWIETNGKRKRTPLFYIKLMKLLMQNSMAWDLVAKFWDFMRDLDLYRRALLTRMQRSSGSEDGRTGK